MAHWADSVPDTLTIEVDNNGTKSQVPLKEQQFVKDTPDLPAFVKRAHDAHTEVGRRIPVAKLDKEEDKANWRKENMPKFYAAGLLEAPPSKPEEYGIKRPDGIDEKIPWDDNLGKEFAGVLHKHGIPKSAVGDLLALQARAIGATMPALKTNYEAAMTALKTEHGDKLDERMEDAKRLTKMIFKDPKEAEFVEQTGLADHPIFLGILLRLAPLARADSSFTAEMNRGGGGGEMTIEQVREKVATIANDKTNPNHAKYWASDPALMKEIDGWYEQAVGKGTVTV